MVYFGGFNVNYNCFFMRVKKTKTSWRHLVEMFSYGKQCCLDKMKAAKNKREYMYWRTKFQQINEAEETAWFIIDTFEKAKK